MWLLVLFAGCANLRNWSPIPRRTVLAADRVDLPTVQVGGDLLAIYARVNGAGPYRLLVDTGCGLLTVSPAVAVAAGLKPQFSHDVGAETGGFRAMLAHIDRVESGGLTLEDLYAVILPPGNLVLEALGCDGIVGIADFDNVVLEIDFPANQVSVIRQGTQSYPLEVAVPFSGVFPEVVIDVAGVKSHCLVDTGFEGGIDVAELDSYPLVSSPSWATVTGLGQVIFKNSSSNLVEVAQLAGVARLGPITWVNPPLSGHSQGRGLIGVKALGRFRFAIDQHGHAVYFLGPNHVRVWPKN